MFTHPERTMVTLGGLLHPGHVVGGHEMDRRGVTRGHRAHVAVVQSGKFIAIVSNFIPVRYLLPFDSFLMTITLFM